MSESFRQLLRALPDFPEVLPDFDPAAAPADPAELFRLWLAEALAAGVPQPNACSLATADAQGRPSSRMLILKDIDDDGWHFATSRDLPQGPGTRGQPARGAELLLAAAGPAGPGGRRRRGALRGGVGRGLARPARRGRQRQSGLAALRRPARARSNSGRPGTTAGTSATATAPDREHAAVNPS